MGHQGGAKDKTLHSKQNKNGGEGKDRSAVRTDMR